MSDKYVLNEEETRKMHNIQLKMMIELDKICRKHNIKYILDLRYPLSVMPVKSGNIILNIF